MQLSESALNYYSMENNIVHKFSRLFPSSFSSCQFRNLPDVVENPIVISKTSNNHVLGASSRTQSSIKTQESKSNKNHLKIPKGSNKTHRPNKESNVIKSSSSNSGWFSSDGRDEFSGETEDAFFSLSSGYFSESFRPKTASKRYNQRSYEMGRCSSELSANSISTATSENKVNGRVGSNLSESKWVKSINGLEFPTSKTEQNRAKIAKKIVEKQTRSGGRTRRKTSPAEKFDYYSDSNSDNTRRKTTKCRRKTGRNHRKIKKLSLISSDKIGQFSIVIDGRIEESIAVEKNTSDPYNDFRTSMVEMIVEKQIFGVDDLQRLLHCFLSLNSPFFHKIIFEVFSEICEALFTNW
ncbi:transcription repressor OFP7-like [Nicotiana tomentosiformis]|uniref:Transcription repressor n=1 Tax=Nicotiana tabacum TaxID=4097 RepID=A0A1S3ZW36_TOBAC|nr:transcription repressor OFP7-like [Nicotiana tomentosiformis]XP_016468640.1 PREDICTED: transcription repressor OFP7-like [Nicotiana tabacum]